MERLGIHVIVEHRPERRSKGEETVFNLAIQRPRGKTAERFFIPLTKLQFSRLQRAVKIAEIDGSHIGDVTMWVRDKYKYNPENVAQWGDVSPFYNIEARLDRFPKEEGRKQTLESTGIARSGIGSRIHVAIAHYMARKFPEHQVSHIGTGTDERKAQLAAMGIDYRTKYPMGEYMAILTNYVKARRAAGKY